MTTSTQALPIAELVLYLSLIPFVTWGFLRHGKSMLFIWLLLLLFSIIQVVAAAIQINNSSDIVGLILSSVGLSPILLASLSIVGEIYFRTTHHKGPKYRIAMAKVHAFIVVGVVLLAVGVSGLLGSNPTSTDLSLWKAGAALVLVAWILVVLAVVWLYASFQVHLDQTSGTSPLFWSLVGAMPLLGIRVFYGIIYACTQSANLSPFYGSIAVKVCLIFLPQLLACACLISGGLIASKRQLFQPHMVAHGGGERDGSPFQGTGVQMRTK